MLIPAFGSITWKSYIQGIVVLVRKLGCDFCHKFNSSTMYDVSAWAGAGLIQPASNTHERQKQWSTLTIDVCGCPPSNFLFRKWWRLCLIFYNNIDILLWTLYIWSLFAVTWTWAFLIFLPKFRTYLVIPCYFICFRPSSVLWNLACKNGTQGDVQDQDQYNDRSNPKQAPQKHSDLAALTFLKLPQAPISSWNQIHLYNLYIVES